MYAGIGICIAAVLASVFYQSWIAAILLQGIVPLYLREKKKELCKKQKFRLNEQFKEVMLTVSVNLRAGYSVENAFREAYKDSCLMFGIDSDMSKELLRIAKGLDNNVILENLLFDFGERSGSDSIRDFAEIFQIAKRSGGDMYSIIQSTVAVICEKVEVKKEIETLLCAKKYEQKIMNAVPILIILYMRGTSPGFFNPLYHNLLGIIIMTVCLGLYMAAYFLAKKITDIEI